jgi:hypothetical protein
MCTKCGETKDISEYHVRKRNERYLIERKCKTCANSELREKYQHRSRDNKRQRTARQLNLTLEDYLDLISRDCYACGTPAKEERQNGVYVNRNTGQIAGVVCTGCAHMLGMLNHDPARIAALLRLTEYSN